MSGVYKTKLEVDNLRFSIFKLDTLMMVVSNSISDLKLSLPLSLSLLKNTGGRLLK